MSTSVTPAEIREATNHEEIARRARELWEQDGCQPGNDVKHWLEAEHQLRSVSPGEVKGIPSLSGKPVRLAA